MYSYEERIRAVKLYIKLSVGTGQVHRAQLESCRHIPFVRIGNLHVDEARGQRWIVLGQLRK